MSGIEKIINAFPKEIREKVLSLLGKVSLKSSYGFPENISDTFIVKLKGEKIEIPYRIYFEEPFDENLDETEKLILNCLFSRNCDGFIRQRSLRLTISAREYWTAPFIFQLIGEYVIEILFEIEKHFSETLLVGLARFSQDNPEFYHLTKSRVVSYWNEYYRSEFTNIENYVGFQLLQKIDNYIDTNKI